MSAGRPLRILCLVSLFFVTALAVPSFVGAQCPATCESGPQLPTAPASLEVSDDDELGERLLNLVDRRLRAMRQELAREIEELVASRRGDAEASVERRLAQLEEENSRLKRALRELRGATGDAAEDNGQAEAVAGTGFLGVSSMPARPEAAARAQSDPGSCLEVMTVLEGSPAASIGLQVGDVITHVDGAAASQAQFSERLAAKKPGDKVQITYYQTRGNRSVKIEAQTELANRDSFREAIAELTRRMQEQARNPEAVAEPAPEPARDEKLTMGFTVEAMDGGRVEVVEVTDGSNAAVAGLRSGDRLTQLGETKIGNLDDIRGVLGSWKVGDRARIGYQRGDVAHSAVVILGSAQSSPRLVTMDQRAPRREPTDSARPIRLGVSVEEADGALEIVEVVNGSNAAEAGLQVGDRLLNVDGKRIRDITGLREVLGKWSDGHEAALRYRRGDKTFRARLLVAGEGGSPKLTSLREGDRRGRDNNAAPSRTQRSNQPGFLGVRPSVVAAGLRVDEVIDGTTAQDMGLREGDIITHVNGTSVSSFEALGAQLRALRAGDSIEIKYLRDGASREKAGKLGARPEENSQSAAPQPATEEPARVAAPEAPSKNASVENPGSLGLVGLEHSNGVMVEELLAGSGAGDAGIRAGDVIVEAAGRSVAGFSDLRTVLAGKTSGEHLQMTVVRDGQRHDFRVPLVAAGAEAPAAASGRPFVGVELEELIGEGQVHVLGVDAGGPADSIGLRKGDQLLRFGEVEVSNLDQVRDALVDRHPGDRVELEIRRAGANHSFELILGGK